MIFEVAKIITRVYDLLDENAEILEERVEYADPGTQLGPLIAGLLPRAARETLTEIPASRIDECRTLRDVASGPEYSLPDDFLRLIYIRMSDWEEGVTEALAYGSESHRLRSRHAGGSRAYRRPGVAIRRTGARRHLLIYGSEAGSRIAELDYVAVPNVENGHIDLPPGVVHDVCERLAEYVTRIIGPRCWK